MTTQRTDDGGHQYPVFEMGDVQNVAYTDTAGVITNGVRDSCRLVMVWCSTDAHIAVGAAPTATTSDRPVTAKVDTIVALEAGDKVSAVRQGSSGTLYVTELL